MFTAPQSDPVTFWQPSFSLPNVIVVAAAKAQIVPHLPAVCPSDAPLEMVHVTSPLDALALVDRGRISAVMLVDPQQGEGWTQVMVNGMVRPKTPRFVLLSNRVPVTHSQGWVRLHPAVSDPTAFRNLVLACVAEAQRAPDKGPVTPMDFFRGASCFQEAAWVRVTGEAGTGDLCFRGGSAVYAEAGRRSGRAAVDEILSWGPCAFEYRDFPAVLPSNVNQPLAELTCGRAAASVPSQTAAPTAAAAIDLEEPTDFPTFEAAGEPQQAPTTVESDIEEPDEFPDLGAMAGSAGGYDQQEPEGGGITNDLDAPPFPEFSGEDAGPVAQAEAPEGPPEPPAPPPEDFGLRSTIFLSVAVIEDGVMDVCEPASSHASFDAAAIYHLYQGMERYVQAQSMGATNSVLLRATQSSLVVTRVPGTGKLLAARLSGVRFGAAEDMELHRLIEQVNAPAIFR